MSDQQGRHACGRVGGSGRGSPPYTTSEPWRSALVLPRRPYIMSGGGFLCLRGNTGFMKNKRERVLDLLHESLLFHVPFDVMKGQKETFQRFAPSNFYFVLRLTVIQSVNCAYSADCFPPPLHYRASYYLRVELNVIFSLTEELVMGLLELNPGPHGTNSGNRDWTGCQYTSTFTQTYVNNTFKATMCFVVNLLRVRGDDRYH